MTIKSDFVNGEEDRISCVPDDILCHILSLVPSVEAVRAGILSTRWRNLWASVDNLELDAGFLSRIHSKDKEKQTKIEKSFSNYVMKMINKTSNRAYISTLSVSARKVQVAAPLVLDAVKGEVRDLKLHFHAGLMDLVLPSRLFISKSLVVLKLDTDYLSVVDSVSLPNLKTFHLSALRCSTDLYLEVFLSGCPAIEDLVIKRRARGQKSNTTLWWSEYWVEQENTMRLDISFPVLKRFESDFPARDVCGSQFSKPSYELVFNAPKLEYLCLRDYRTRFFSVIDLGSLVEAYVDCKPALFMNRTDCCIQILGLLNGITTVKSLSLSSHTIEALNDVRNMDLPTFNHLKKLEFGVSGGFCYEFLAKFLCFTPELEYLTLIHKEQGKFRRYYCWTPPEHVPDCLLYRLKEITIEGLHEYHEVELIEYLLQHSQVLNKLTVKLKRGDVNEKQAHTFIEEVSRVHRSSLASEITVLS